VQTRNLLQPFLENAEKLGDQPCLQFKKEGNWSALSWKEAAEEARKIAVGLKALGVKKGDRVGLFSSTRPEWTLCDLAILSLGAVTVPIYPSNTAEQAAYILENSGARVAFVETEEQHEKVASMRKKLPDLGKILFLTEQVAEGDEGDLRRWRKGIEEIRPGDLATIVYTSGTTGPPKGAVLSHSNFIAEAEALMRLFDFGPGDLCFLYLPLAHIFARAMQFWQIAAGYTHSYAESLEKLFENIREVRPHFFTTVPRVLEKLYEKLRNQPPEAVRGAFGGNLRCAISGGAPLAREIGEFLHSKGVLIVEGYGLTETTAGIFINSEKENRFGSVGKILHRMEARIAEDGEILVRGPMIFQGYFKNEEATREAMADDGWFKTGDVGEIDDEGFLKITDRKKDLIITSAGKNIAPQNLENLLKTIPFVSQVMVCGDRRNYLTALVTLNREAVEQYARANQIAFGDFKDLVRHPKIFELIQQAIEEKNKTLASFETIKKFAILENDFSQEAGELTPTLKVRRKFVSEKYKEILDRLYQDS
jgi:long-chain acyl-CoA synthetase